MWKLWKERRINGRKEGIGKSENVKEKIQQWLGQEGFDVRNTGRGNSEFRYLVAKNRLPKFSVGQPKNKSDRIVIASGIGFKGIDTTELTKIFSRSQNVSWELRLHLTAKGFFYKIQPPNSQTNSQGGIVFAKQVYYDELSKAKFLETVFQVINAAIFIMLTLQRHLTAPTQRSKPTKLPYSH